MINTEFAKHEGSICDLINVDCPSSGCDDCTKIQKVSWEKALRWVLSIDSGFCSCGCMNVDKNNSTQEKIEEELKNLNQSNSHSSNS